VLFCGGRVVRRLGRLGRIESGITAMEANGLRFSRSLHGRAQQASAPTGEILLRGMTTEGSSARPCLGLGAVAVG
jgi:hypothetical protein